MRVVSWNINSVRIRQHLLEQLFRDHNPDIICLQETKCQNEHFIHEFFQEHGYNVYCNGQKSYNGVAILTKKPVDGVEIELKDFNHQEARFMKVYFDDFCVYNLYVPNGQLVNSQAYFKQITYLEALIEDVRNCEASKIVVVGDFNVAPADRDVDARLLDCVLCDPELRRLWRELLGLGLTEHIKQYTWWDYRFKGNVGARIDNILTNFDDVADAKVLLDHRFGCLKPSDHVPIMIEVK